MIAHLSVWKIFSQESVVYSLEMLQKIKWLEIKWHKALCG